jgi:transcriptional regulator with XRE-family HTH domain
MEQTYLPGKIRDRIQDLMKSRKVTQAELATRIGCSESSLSRFISGKTDKLGDENIIRIARVFNVSTDFLLGEVDTPDRLNYDIAELAKGFAAQNQLYATVAGMLKIQPEAVDDVKKL